MSSLEVIDRLRVPIWPLTKTVSNSVGDTGRQAARARLDLRFDPSLTESSAVPENSEDQSREAHSK
jgi:hypothetical protein